jgi:hypothetical protein
MQQFIKVYNPLTNGIKEFTFTHADDTKYVYCNNEDKSLLLYVYKKSNHPKGGKITSLPWKNEKVYSKGRKYMMPEGIPFCFEL